MSVGSVALSNNAYGGSVNNYMTSSPSISYEEISSLVSHSDEQDIEQGSIFGMAGFLRCAYSSESTAENPLVEVYVKDETYTIDINKVNPKAATNIEMFAYCEYMDDKGLMPNEGMGSYTTLMISQEMALHNGFVTDDGSGIFDWTEIAESVKELMYRCGDMIQYMRINAVMDVIDRHLGMEKKSHEDDSIDWKSMYESFRKPITITDSEGEKRDISLSLDNIMSKPCLEVGTGRVLYDGKTKEMPDEGDQEKVYTDYGYSCYLGDEGPYMLTTDLERLITESKESGDGWIRKYREILGDSPINEAEENIENTVSELLSNGSKETLEWSEYDVTNMTFENFKDFSMDLYNAGEITLLDHAIMTFNPLEATERYGFEESYFKTTEKADGSRNWIEEFKARYEYDAKYGNDLGMESNKRILDILSTFV